MNDRSKISKTCVLFQDQIDSFNSLQLATDIGIQVHIRKAIDEYLKKQ